MTEKGLRALVLDRDDQVYERVGRVLDEVNVRVARSRTIEEACALLSECDLFVVDDMDLLESTGPELLALILTEPQNFVLMTKGPGALSSLSRWADLVVNRLPKPFTSGDARGAMRRLFTAMGRSVPMLCPVVAARSGEPWCDSLREVLGRAGGTLDLVTSDEVVQRVQALRSPIVVLDSKQVGASQLKTIADAFRADPALSVEIVVAAHEDNGRDLLAQGATKVFRVPGHVGDLTAAVTRVLGLSRRTHPRATLTDEVELGAPGRRTLRAQAVDVGESGMGVKDLDTPPFLEMMTVAFRLPGATDPIRATAEVVWTAEGPPGVYRAGLRFLGLDDNARARIYRFIVAATEASEARARLA